MKASVHILAIMVSMLMSATSFAQTLDSSGTSNNTPPHALDSLPQNIEKRTIMALRSNLIVPASNIGLEFCIGDSWSIGADYYFPWIKRQADHQNALQLLGWGLEGRYWFGKSRKEDDRLKGHSIGLSTYAGYYDFERSYTGIQGEFATVGLDYLYAMSICKGKLHLEFNLGLGYIYSYVKPYDVFETGGKAFKEGYIKNFHWIGPVKAGVSLVVPIRITKDQR